MKEPMPKQPHDPDRVIQLVQSSTKNLMESFRGKTELLRQCSKDIKLLIREGYDKRTVYDAAIKLFGKDRTKFIAIDGTESQDQELDMLVFYAGAFGYVGQIKFENTGKGCSYDEPVEFENNMNIFAAIPVHEQDTAKVAGQVTEGGIEVDTERIPSTLMNLSEYYMAVRAVTDDPEIQVVMLDRTLAGDLSHLVWSVNEMLESDSCVLLGIDTSYGKVTSLDLELTRMLHPNDSLGTPAARSHLLKYAAILQLMKMNNHAAATATTTSSSAASDAADSNLSSSSSTNTTTNVEEEGISYENLLSLIGGNKERLEKLQRDITKFNERYAMLDDRVPVGLKLKQGVEQYWERVFEASMKLCDYIFNTPEGKHPLVIEKEKSPLPQQRQEQEEQEQQMSTTTRNSSMEEAAAGIHETETTTRWWITANDLDYLLLVMIYALLRLAWQRSVLVFGIIKDVNSAELVKTVDLFCNQPTK